MAVIDYEKMARNIAEKALNEYEYKGKTLLQWAEELESEQTRLPYDDLAFLRDLCMKEMALLASAEKYKAMDLVEDFQRAKRIALKLDGMMLAVGEQND